MSEPKPKKQPKLKVPKRSKAPDFENPQRVTLRLPEDVVLWLKAVGDQTGLTPTEIVRELMRIGEVGLRGVFRQAGQDLAPMPDLPPAVPSPT